MKCTISVNIEYKDEGSAREVFSVRRRVEEDGIEEVRITGDRNSVGMGFTLEQARVLAATITEVCNREVRSK